MRMASSVSQLLNSAYNSLAPKVNREFSDLERVYQTSRYGCGIATGGTTCPAAFALSGIEYT